MHSEDYLEVLGQHLESRGYRCRHDRRPGPDPQLIAVKGGTFFVVACLEAPTEVGLRRFAHTAWELARRGRLLTWGLACYPLSLSNSLGAELRKSLTRSRSLPGFPVVRLAPQGELIYHQGSGWGSSGLRRHLLAELPPNQR